MAPRPRELEAKLPVRDDREARAVLAALGAPAATERVAVHDVYWDTADRALLAAGYGLRVRRLPDGSHEATVKGLAAATAGPFADREERTVPLAAERPDLALLPDGPVRTLVARVAGERALVPLARVTGRRRRAVFAPTPALRVEVDDDRVRLEAGRARVAHREVEVERLRGSAAAFAAWLRGRLGRRLPRAAATSKLERALRASRVPLPTPARVAAGRLVLGPELPPRASAARGAARALARQAVALATAFEGARRGAVEGVHALRTTSRRVRTLLAAFGDEVPRRDRVELRRRLRALRAAAGPARDLDVVRASLAAAGDLPPEGARALRAALAARRRTARRALAAALATPALKPLPDLLADVAARTAARGGPPLAVAGAARLPASLEGVLAQRARVDGGLASADADALHALRIAGKRARYAAEAFAPWFGRPLARFGDAARALQDGLGRVQDARTVAEVLRSALRAVPAGRARAAAADAVRTMVERAAREGERARTRLDALADAALSPRALRDLLAHLGKRAGAAARAAP